MKKLLLFTFALFLWTGAWAQDINLCAADGVTATLIKDDPTPNTDVSNALNGIAVQPNYYDSNGEMNIVVDLLESKTINGFAITFAGDRWVSKFTLSYSADGVSYTKIGDYLTGREAQNPETKIFHSFNSGIVARYIKYTSKKSNKNVDDGYSETIKNFRLLQYGSIPAIPDITSDSHKLGIFSHDLGNTTGYGWQAWSSTTSFESFTIQEKNAIKFTNFTYYGSGFDKIDATGYSKLHLDIYALYTGTIAIFPITGKPEKGIQADVTENTWTPIDINIDDFVDLELNMANLYQIKYVESVNQNNGPVNGGGTHSFIIGNVYLYGTPIVDTEKPTMASVTVASTTHRSATLTVNATDNVTTGKLTYKVKNSSDVVVGTGIGTQGKDVTVVISGLTASTDFAAGDFKVTATDHAGNESDAMNVPAFSTDAATGQIYTNGSHEILVQPRHYAGTFDYELIVISEEAMTNFSNSYWKLNGGPGGTLMNNGDITLSEGGKVMTVKVRSTTAPVMDTPLYINMPGEVTFKESDDKNPVYNWIEVASEKTYDVMVNGDKAVVIGTISASNLSDFQTAVGNTSVIDISGAAIDESIDKLTTNNVNAIFDYKTVEAYNAATKTTNSVYTINSRFYGAPNGLTFVDAPATTPLLLNKCYASINSAEEKSVVINRSIAANSYVTTFMSLGAGSLSATLDDGLEAYELTAATAGQLTFTKTTESLSRGKGYVIHNTTSGALNLAWKSTGVEVYFDVDNQNPESVEAIDGVKILGTMQTVTTDGNQWILSGGEIMQANKAKITAYRAYFTGVTLPASGKASAVFVDGETTKIGSINANGEINVENGAVYNLAGQRVAHPTKGLYIVNGKKVIIK